MLKARRRLIAFLGLLAVVASLLSWRLWANATSNDRYKFCPTGTPDPQLDDVEITQARKTLGLSMPELCAMSPTEVHAVFEKLQDLDIQKAEREATQHAYETQATP